jgi:26S proteasome regulatory subunit N2
MDYLLDLLHDLLLQMCQCLIFLKEPLAVADILEMLSAGSSTDALMAYQIAFDMYESATQQFLSRVLAAIKKTRARRRSRS